MNALPSWILIEDTKQLIARSVIRTEEDPEQPNKRLDQLRAEPKNPSQKVIEMKDLIPNVILPVIVLDQLIGHIIDGQQTMTTEAFLVPPLISEPLTNIIPDVPSGYSIKNLGERVLPDLHMDMSHPPLMLMSKLNQLSCKGSTYRTFCRCTSSMLSTLRRRNLRYTSSILERRSLRYTSSILRRRILRCTPSILRRRRT